MMVMGTRRGAWWWSTKHCSRRRTSSLAAAAEEGQQQQSEHRSWAYDEALKVIAQDREEKQKLVKVAETRLQRALTLARTDHTRAHERRIKDIRNDVEEARVAVEINDPQVRRQFQVGDIDMTRPVMRYLARQRWELGSRLPRLLQRLHQMHVVPDTIPDIHPVVDVQLRFGEREVEAGEFLPCDLTRKVPSLSIQQFQPWRHPLYTIAILDPDTPDIDNDSFTTTLHMLTTNATVTLKRPLVVETPVMEYLPPHPHKGTAPHRLAVLVFSQKEPIPADALPARESFDVRQYVAQHQLHPVGAHLWRSKWDEYVDDILQELNVPRLQFKR